MTAPTVDDILQRTLSGTLWCSGVSLHQWRTDSGVIEVPTSELRPALEAAYDPLMPNWPAMVQIDDA